MKNNNFLKLWEEIHRAKDDDSPPEETKAMSAIRMGNNLDKDFWDNFILLLNNSSGLSDLLDVPETRIMSWKDKIETSLKQVNKIDKNQDSSKKNKIIHTGY